MEVTRYWIKIGARRPITPALETMTGSALGLVENRRSGEVRRMLGSNLDVVCADDLPIELMGKCGHLWTWMSALDEHNQLLGLAEEARLGCMG